MRDGIFSSYPGLIAVQMVACSAPARNSAPSKAPATSASSSLEPTTSQRVNADSFSGPIIAHCTVRSQSTTLSKLNIDTGELVDIATFPVPCLSPGQIDRLKFSPEFRKVAIGPDNDNHVKYYESETGSTVDVTNIVSPLPTGDFGNHQPPIDQNPQFDEQGFFVFYDGNTSEFKFFDTDSKKVVRTSKTYMPHLLKLMTDSESLEYGGLPDPDSYRLCSSDFLWIMDDGRYLRSVHDENDSSREFLAIDSIPAPHSSSETRCNKTAARRITPPSSEITHAAADPNNSTIIFMVTSATDPRMWNLYRANLKDPSQPTQIRMSGNILEHAGMNGTQDVGIIGWQ